METENKLTVLEVIKMAHDKLEAISVPVKLMQIIGSPIIEAAAMLQAAVAAMETAEREAKEEQAGE